LSRTIRGEQSITIDISDFGHIAIDLAVRCEA
jgi:hypothetical protein